MNGKGGRSMQTCLFLCTGNYYRSRFAEIYFNALAGREGVLWQAESRGLHIEAPNPGPISQATLAWLRNLQIEPPAQLRMPLSASEEDFLRANVIVAVKEAEHRPLMIRKHPAWVDRVEYWHIHDQDVAQPQQAIPELISHVDQLFKRLLSQSGK